MTYEKSLDAGQAVISENCLTTSSPLSSLWLNKHITLSSFLEVKTRIVNLTYNRILVHNARLLSQVFTSQRSK